MHGSSVALLVALAGVLAVACAQSGLNPVVVTPAGAVRGIEVFNSYQFLGIPFAQPPVGALRFARPQPAAPWDGVLDALHFAPDCMQDKNGLAGHNISEDCLYLNVYVPANRSADAPPLPVMFWLHGGSWSWGGDSFAFYNGNFLLNALNDVIIVTAQYRLQAFGWSASSALAAEDPLGSTGNAGLQDQRMAMEWVKANIAAFGGDPGRMTIWGESAGGGSVSTHMVAQASWPLFHGAIIESGPPANWTAVSLELAESHWDRMVAALNCESSIPANVVACMRAQSAEALIANQENANNALVSWSPVVDGVELTDIPPQLVRQGLFNRVPVLLGSNHDEGTLLISVPAPPPPFTESDYVQWVNETVGAQWADQVLAMYPASQFPSPWWAAVRLFGDVAMSCPVRRNARWFTEASDPIPVYSYFFTHIWTVALVDPNLGVFHGSELIAVWDFWPVMILESERQMARWFGHYWTNFAVYGNPNGPSGDSSVPLTWPAYEQATDSNINLDLELSIDVGLKSTECDLWDQIYLAEHPL